MIGRRGHRRPKMTWRSQVGKQVKEIKPRKEDAINIPKRCDAVNKLLRITRGLQPPLLMKTKPDLIHGIFLSGNIYSLWIHC